MTWYNNNNNNNNITGVKVINKINKNLQNDFEIINIIDHFNVTQVIQIHFVYKRDEIFDKKLQLEKSFWNYINFAVKFINNKLIEDV